MALGTEALFAPEEGAELAFGVIVRWLDDGVVDEGSEREPMLGGCRRWSR